jgi:ferredoxin-NADP reductase
VDPGGGPVPAALPGQYLTLRLPGATAGRALLRNYSLSGPPGADDYRISVKREPGGAGSGYLHERLGVGDRLDVAAPRGAFVLRPAETPVLLVSAGVGATPLLAMLHALAADHSEREVWWLHGARGGGERPFAAEAARLLAALPDARSHVCLSRPGPDDVEGRDFQTAGRVTAALLASLGPPADADAYLCGPAPFMAEVSAALAADGLPAAHIRTEPFGPAAPITPGIAAAPSRPPHPPAARPPTGPTVEFARSDLAVTWDPDDVSLLELAEACDVPVRWSCRTGVCRTCETALVSGSVDYAPEPVESPAGGTALICCARPRGDVVLDL